MCPAGIGCKKGDGVVDCLTNSREATIEESLYNAAHHMVRTHGDLAGRDVHLGKLLGEMREITFHRRGGDGGPDETFGDLGFAGVEGMQFA